MTPAVPTDAPAVLPAPSADVFRAMLTIRRFEERCLDLGAEGLISGSIHLCLGQEAIPVGAMAALDERDRVLTTYRGHGWAIACGVPLDLLLGELCQRAGGLNGGRGGSPHFFAPRWRMLGENSIVGAGVPIAAGVAMASQRRADGGVVVASVGDGAMNQGSVHEALVFSAAQRLPLILICENNGWAEMTPGSAFALVEHLADRASAYGIASRVVDGCDPSAVSNAVAEAADGARAGAGPVLLECKTVRLSGHYNRDLEHYRAKADREAAQAADPIAASRAALLDAGTISAEELDALGADVDALIDQIVETVRGMGEPDPSTARDHLYAPRDAPTPIAGTQGSGIEMTYVKAVNAALRSSLEQDASVVVYGEDVGSAGGIFGATRNLQEEFGVARVFDTPIAESAILGSAVGAAMQGLRPVVEIMWADFVLVALDQIINQAANVRYVSRSELTAPLVVRMQQGATPGSCAQHSQNLEALLAHVPGIRVGLAATPQDVFDMLRAAIADPDPCVVIEARRLYQLKGLVDVDTEVRPIGGARVHREGDDAVLLTWGTMVADVVQAAEQLAAQGINVAVADLRWLNPLDEPTIARLVRSSRGRVLIAHEANVTGGFGAELAARIQSDHFDYLDAPVARLGVPDSRIPSAPALQQALLPDAADVVRALETLLAA
jgi:2-oxoisovalerate dehydrogenase E1 component